MAGVEQVELDEFVGRDIGCDGRADLVPRRPITFKGVLNRPRRANPSGSGSGTTKFWRDPNSFETPTRLIGFFAT
jgi:hypothetical protein